MEKLIIENTETNLGVYLDNEENKLFFRGESRPEDCKVFFDPIIKWVTNYRNYLYYKVNEYNTQNINVEVVFELDYFNSTSAKYILDIFLEIKELIKQNPTVNVKIDWLYKIIDEDMKDCGEEFIAMTELSINLVPN